MNRRFAISVMCLSLMTVVACGTAGSEGGATDSGEQDAGETTEVTVGLLPIVDVAPIYLGMEQGIFEDHGISLTPEFGQGGSAILPAVTSGDYQFGFSNVVSLLTAHAQGLDVRITSPGVSSTGEAGADYGGVLVREESDIDSIDDLAGRSVGINALLNINDALIREAVANAGTDPSSVDFVEIGFPDLVPALEDGNVEAIFVPEPFFTIGKNEGAREIFSLYAEVVPELVVSTYFTSGELQESDPDLVERFDAAVRESMEYAEQHPEEARETVLSYTEIGESVVSELTLPAWPSELNEESIRRLGEIAREHGAVDGEVDYESLLP